MNELLVCSAAEAEFAESLTWYVERSVTAAELLVGSLADAILGMGPVIAIPGLGVTAATFPTRAEAPNP